MTLASAGSPLGMNFPNSYLHVVYLFLTSDKYPTLTLQVLYLFNLHCFTEIVQEEISDTRKLQIARGERCKEHFLPSIDFKIFWEGACPKTPQGPVPSALDSVPPLPRMFPHDTALFNVWQPLVPSVNATVIQIRKLYCLNHIPKLYLEFQTVFLSS